MKTYSQRYAEFIVNHRYENLPEEVVTMTKQCVLDWAGSVIAGSIKPPAEKLNAAIEPLGGTPQATNVITGGKTSMAWAALLNGAACHIVELDDVHKGSIFHAAAPIISAALAVAEGIGATPQAFLEAVVLGYDVAIRIGEAVTPSHYKIFHTTGTVGTFGAAVAAGKLLGLTEEQMAHALGTAGTSAAALWEFIEDGAMSKHYHPGKAAMEGVLAALTARQGFTAASRILEGNRGFFAGMVEEVHEALLWDRLGQHYKIMENSFKIHASCRHTHHAVDVALKLRQDPRFNLEKIDRIVIETYQVALDIAGNPNPQSVYQAKFSIGYCASLAFVYGSAGLLDFTEARLFDPEIRRLLQSTEVKSTAEMEKDYPRLWPAKVKVYLKDGTVIEGRTDAPKGDPENPVTYEEIESKVINMGQTRFSQAKMEAIAKAMRELENRSLGDFTATLVEN